MPNPRPRSLTIDRPRQELVIEWLDGARCAYPLPGLRYVCPCVSCRGGHANMGAAIDPADLAKSPPPDVSTAVVSAHFVGDYALQIVWGDGHNGGIYTWTLLRPLCVSNQ